MSPGQQVALVVIDNGVVVQHAPQDNTIELVAGQRQNTAVQNTAVHMVSFQALCNYLEDLHLFKDEE